MRSEAGGVSAPRLFGNGGREEVRPPTETEAAAVRRNERRERFMEEFPWRRGRDTTPGSAASVIEMKLETTLLYETADGERLMHFGGSTRACNTRTFFTLLA